MKVPVQTERPQPDRSRTQESSYPIMEVASVVSTGLRINDYVALQFRSFQWEENDRRQNLWAPSHTVVSVSNLGVSSFVLLR